MCVGAFPLHGGKAGSSDWSRAGIKGQSIVQRMPASGVHEFRDMYLKAVRTKVAEDVCSISDSIGITSYGKWALFVYVVILVSL